MKLNLIYAAALAFAIPAAAAGTPTPCTGTHQLERTSFLMGTVLRIELAGVGEACAIGLSEAVFARVSAVETVLSSWSPEAELAELNAGSAAPVRVTPALAGWLTEAGHWVGETGGAFDPAVGALIDAWDLRGAGRVPDSVALASARDRSGWTALEWLSRDEVRGGGPGWWIDTGAFGKGVALREAAAVLKTAGVERALLDFGGQFMAIGSWDISVAHPARRQETLVDLRVTDASVATTSSSERFVEIDGTRYGHVLDPRSGWPVPAWGSVTVVAADPARADALSTALFVMGPDAALEWARDREDVGVLVLRASGSDVHVEYNGRMRTYLRS